MPNKFQFVMRNEIRSELQNLDERWTKLKGVYTDLVDFTSKLHSEWVTCGESLQGLQDWTAEMFNLISSEKQMKYRSGPKLQEFLDQFKVYE